jgi:hypothetical protein
LKYFLDFIYLSHTDNIQQSFRSSSQCISLANHPERNSIRRIKCYLGFTLRNSLIYNFITINSLIRLRFRISDMYFHNLFANRIISNDNSYSWGQQPRKIRLTRRVTSDQLVTNRKKSKCELRLDRFKQLWGTIIEWKWSLWNLIFFFLRSCRGMWWSC